jgi:Zn-dependent M28 family amino/carboxypeptidase
VRILLSLVALVALASCSGGDAQTGPAPLPDAVAPITVAQMREHLDALQAIADRAGGTRASATPGYAASVRYVERILRKLGLEPEEERFPLAAWRELAPPEVSANDEPIEGAVAMQYSPGGNVTAALDPVDLADPVAPTEASTSGCEQSDFDGFPTGHVALVQRGTCFMAEKARNAAEAGAAALVVFNAGTPGNTDALQGTLVRPGVPIPVVGVGFDDGAALASDRPTVGIRVRAEVRRVMGVNVLAEIPGGDDVVLLGAHLDSVPRGPGINDNGSGVATLLATAAALRDAHPQKTIRFAFWDAEELGLHGSTAYVERLSDQARDAIDAVVNVDMVASPNGGLFIGDGDGSSGSEPGPPGSDEIEDAFHAAFRALGLPEAPADLDPQRTDLAPFVRAGIPGGGVFSGAEGRKTPEEASAFGGESGAVYDGCYHQACDRADSADARRAADLAGAVALAVRALAGA